MVSEGTLSPAFDSSIRNYEVNVANSVTSVNITATANNAKATITGTGTQSLIVGENSFPVKVTAMDGSTSRTYTVKIYRADAVAATNADLSSLTVSDGTLTPAFNAATITYAVDVAYAVESINIDAIVSDANAVVSGNGNKILQVGSNPFQIIVTAQNGTTKTYTVTVNRSAQSTDATLSNLMVSEGTLTPVFNPSTMAYTVNIDNASTTISLTAIKNHEGATLTGDGLKTYLQPGENNYQIIVTAENGTAQLTYTVTVNRTKSADATLRHLSVFPGALSPVFDPATKSYTVDVEDEVSSVIIMATSNHSGAAIEGAGEKALQAGSNPFTVKVTAQNNSVDNYQVIVNRGAPSGLYDPATGINIWTVNNTIYATFNGEAVVSLYTVSGVLLHQVETSYTYSQPADKGIYMLKINDMVYKIIL